VPCLLNLRRMGLSSAHFGRRRFFNHLLRSPGKAVKWLDVFPDRHVQAGPSKVRHRSVWLHGSRYRAVLATGFADQGAHRYRATRYGSTLDDVTILRTADDLQNFRGGSAKVMSVNGTLLQCGLRVAETSRGEIEFLAAGLRSSLEWDHS
jgi:hypothetical protein